MSASGLAVDLQRRFAVTRDAGAISLGLQVEFQALGQMLLVLNDENVRRSTHTVAPPSTVPPGVRIRGNCR